MKKYLYLLPLLLLIPVIHVYATDGVSGVEHPAKVNSVVTPDKVCGVSGLAASGESYENFTTYTEEDPNSHITRTTTRGTWVNISKDEDAYLYHDKGVNAFDGDFTFDFEWMVTTDTNNGLVYICVLTNAVDDLKGIDDASGDWIGIKIDLDNSKIVECDGGSIYASGAFAYTDDTLYYIRYKRDDNAGTYGTLYLGVYSTSSLRNAGDATDGDVTNLSLALHSSKKDYRYIFCINTYNTNDSLSFNGYNENYNLGSY